MNSNAVYRTFRVFARTAFATTSRPTISGVEHVPATGPVLVAANHFSWYDIPLLGCHCPRCLDFMATSEMYGYALVRGFCHVMNAIRCDRFQADARAVRETLTRLEQGRAVALFPEGRLASAEESVFTTLPLRTGLFRLAVAAQAPVLPVVLLGTIAYRRFRSWLPLRRTPYGIRFGQPIPPPLPACASDRAAQLQRMEEEYRSRMRNLRRELIEQMKERGSQP